MKQTSSMLVKNREYSTYGIINTFKPSSKEGVA